MALQEDTDTTGDVISVNGQATDLPEDTTKVAEDRGDVVADPEAASEPAKEAPKPAASTDPDPGDSHKPQTIPKVRFDEVNNKKNELAEQLAEAQRVIDSLRQSTQTAAPSATTSTTSTPAFDADAKEQEYIDALLDGNSDLAKSIRRDINNHLMEQAAERVEINTQQRQAAATLQSVSTQAVADFPYLDTDEGAEALELILASRDAKVARGMNIAQALREAVATIAPKFAPDPNTTPPRESTTESARTDTRTTAAIARGAADSNLQPPSLQLGSGDRNSGGRVNVSDMSEEQFENLSAADKKRLRGDQ